MDSSQCGRSSRPSQRITVRHNRLSSSRHRTAPPQFGNRQPVDRQLSWLILGVGAGSSSQPRCDEPGRAIIGGLRPPCPEWCPASVISAGDLLCSRAKSSHPANADHNNGPKTTHPIPLDVPARDHTGYSACRSTALYPGPGVAYVSKMFPAARQGTHWASSCWTTSVGGDQASRARTTCRDPVAAGWTMSPRCLPSGRTRAVHGVLFFLRSARITYTSRSQPAVA